MNATKALLSIVAAMGLATVSTAWAQAPAGSTGECKDNTYTSAASKRGACKGHGGVKEWYATEKSEPKASKSASHSKTKAEAPAATGAATPAPAATTPAAAPPAMSAKPTPTKSASAERSTPAPGGGAGKVWVNTESHVYHCQGTRWYGTTKQGEYMTEAEAKSKGAHADHGKACG